ncbi:MAG TPA: BatA domain-containing protein [Phycisphaerales bacterium]|nr:BatA domain-containing protein [Phycisphaerales bacterium]
MGVLHAGILVGGLAAVALPIIIHLLLRRRKRPMEWGAMRFVLEAYRKTRRRTNLERWLLLACRCLLVAALAVGLARPLVAGRSSEGRGGRTVWLVLDDGLVAQTSEDGKTDLARAIERCKGVLSTLGAGDRAAVVLAGVPARGLVVPPSGNLAGVRSTLESLTPTDTPSDWPGVLGVLGEAIAHDRSQRADTDADEDVVVVAQGARAGAGRIGEPLARLPAGVRVVLAEPSARAPVNIAVTGVRALRPVLITGGEGSEAAQTVTVSLRRFGEGVEKAAVTRVSVRLAGQDGASSTASVPWALGQREATATMVIDSPRAPASAGATGGAVVVAETEGGDAVNGDNAWRLPVVQREALRVGVLADSSARGSVVSGGTADRFRPGQWLSFALRPSESAAVDLVDIEPGAIDAARLAGLDAVVVLSPDAIPTGDGAANGWLRLKEFVSQGGLLVVTPAFEAATQSWPEAMSSGLGVALSLGRAPREYPVDAPGRLSGAAPSDLAAGADVLATLRGELDVLARPVAVTRLLAPLEDGEAREDVKVLLRTADGAPFVTMVTRKGDTSATAAGAVVYLSAALDLRWTDLPAKPLMVPLMQELVRQGVGRARPVFATTAGARAAAPDGAAELRPIEKSADRATLALNGSGLTVEPVRSAGAWRAVDAQGAERGMVAVNAPADADTTPVSRERMAAWMTAALPEKPKGAERPPEVEWAGDDTWRRGLDAVDANKARVGTSSLLLLAALLCALCEVLLARMASASAVRKGKGLARG